MSFHPVILNSDRKSAPTTKDSLLPLILTRLELMTLNPHINTLCNGANTTKLEILWQLTRYYTIIVIHL